MTARKVGLIGLGAMGVALAHHWQTYFVQKSYPSLVYWNRTISKGDDAKKLGAVPARSAAELTSQCDVVFFSLSGDQTMKDMLESIKNNINGKLLCDMSTVLPETNSYVQEFAKANGARYVASPMLGSSQVAWNKGLVLCPSGKKSDFDEISEYLEAASKAIMYLGEDIQLSAKFKITANVFVTGMMELIGEVQTFGEANGISDTMITEWAEKGMGPAVGNYFKKNSSGGYWTGEKGPAPVFSLDNVKKDVGYARKIAAEKGFSLPISNIMNEHLEEAVKMKGTSHMDGAAVYGVIREKANLGFDNEAVKKREQ